MRELIVIKLIYKQTSTEYLTNLYAEEQTITEWQTSEITGNKETQIDITEIAEAIKRLKTSKVLGKNDIKNELVKYGGAGRATNTLNTENNLTTQDTQREHAH